MHIAVTQKHNLRCIDFCYIKKVQNIDSLPNWVFSCKNSSLLELSKPFPKLPELNILDITDQNAGLIFKGINIHNKVGNMVKTILPALNIWQRCAE